MHSWMNVTSTLHYVTNQKAINKATHQARISTQETKLLFGKMPLTSDLCQMFEFKDPKESKIEFSGL